MSCLLAWALACVPQFQLIDEESICRAVGESIAARTQACTGDADLATARFEAFEAEWDCKPGFYVERDDVPWAYECAVAINATDCEQVEAWGDDIDAWLSASDVCMEILWPEGSTDSADTPNTADTAGTTDTGPLVQTLSGTVVSFHTAAPMNAINVCRATGPEFDACVATDWHGSWTMDIPTDSPVTSLVFYGGDTAMAFQPLEPISTTTELQIVAFESMTPNNVAAEAGVTLRGPTWLGVIVVDESGAGLAGATVALDPPSGDGPVYFGGDTRPDGALASTSRNGAAWFANTNAGPVRILVSAEGRTCSAPYPWRGGATPSADLYSPYSSTTRVRCTP